MSKIVRTGSFESAGLKKTRLKNAKEERVDLLFAGQLEDSVSSVRTWIEECIGTKRSNLSFNELIDDGIILCELVQSIRPGVVRKISRVKSRFAYWENYTFFLKACKSLGLQDWQLFDPEELLGQKIVSGNFSSKPPSERRVKNIVAILYWLALTLESSPNYSGPKIDRESFVPSKCANSPTPCINSSYSSIPNPSSSSSSSSSTHHTPEHKLISVSTPNIDKNQDQTPPASPNHNRSSSPFLWVEKVRDKERPDGLDANPYCFKQSDVNLDETACYRVSSQPSVLTGNSTDSSSQFQEFPSKKRKETLSVRVEAYNPPSAFNADLVFVHDSTSSSVFSPTAVNRDEQSEARSPFSPNQLSNTFGATDPIDSTGLIIDPLEFHSEVFTAGTDSQESGPHFSSPRPESTFHVNLTQTSQPDNLSISNTQLDELTGAPSELPVISEVAPNSSPIDTFDLHHHHTVQASPDSNTQTVGNNHSNIEYSHSQEYNEKQIQHIDSHSSNNYNTTSTYNSKPRGGNRSRDNSLTSSKSDSLSTSGSSNASLIVVGYSPLSNSNSVSPLTKRNTYHQVPETILERKPPYRRYSSPQQRPGYKSAKSQVISSDNVPLHSESGSESDQDMSMNKANRASGRKQMKVVPSDIILPDPREHVGESMMTTDLPNGMLTTDLHATFLPGEKHHGITLQTASSHSSYPVVSSVDEDTPAFRCGVQPGDELTKLNDVPLLGLSAEDSNLLLNKAIGQKKLSLSIHRDTINNPTYTPSTSSLSNSSANHNGSIVNCKYQPSTDDVTSFKSNALKQKPFLKFQSLDMKRVQSDALPKHQVASTVYANTVDHDRHPNSSAMTTTSTTKNSRGETLETDVPPSLDANASVVEIESDTGSRYTLSSIGNEGENSSHHSMVDSYPKHVDHTHRHSSVQSNGPPVQPTVSSSPVDYLKDEESLLGSSTGKSQSVTELSTISPLPPLHKRDKSDTGVANYRKARSKAMKTESLPGTFRTQSLHLKDNSPSRSSVSTPGMGLGLTNMSIEDVHSASKLQIDQIWKEVESSSSLVSPVDDYPEDKGRHHLQMDTIYTQTPDEWTNEIPPVPTAAVGSSITSSYQQEDPRTDSSLQSSGGHVATVPVRRSSSKSNEKKGIESLLTTLRSLNEKVGTYEEEEEFKLLESILQSSKFKKAKELHDNMRNMVMTEGADLPQPALRRVVPVSQYIRHFLREDIQRPSQESEELRKLLRKPDIQSTLFCHDKVATHDLYVPSTFFPRSAQDQEDIILTHSALDLPTASLYTTKEAPLSRDIPCNRKENATIVYLQRTNRPLGCAIYKDGDSVFVSKILDGCDAEQSGAIKEGDELLEVNGIALMGKSNDEIIRLMSGEAGKTVSFTLIPVHDDTADLYYEEKYVRAHFSYNGLMDEEIPCKELALNFSRGDILEISNQDDPDWWQARKVFEDGGESLPGLIPARHLQQKREVLKESHAVYNAIEEKNRRRSILSKITRKSKKKKIYYNQGPLSGALHSVGHEVATYEDVVKLMPDPDRKRPIILIGAPSVGRKTLIKRMIESFPRHYSTVTPHVTRSPRPGEVDGRDFHFIAREDMEKAVQDGRFLDYMDYKGHLQGVSISSVKDVIDKGSIPVMDLYPQALKNIGSSGLIPYVIFIAAPRVERLHMTRKVTYEKKKKLQSSLSADFLDRDTRSFTENELMEVYRKSQEIQAEYSHYFDWVVVNDDLQIASDLLLEVARRIEEEPQWVSASWVEEV